MSSYWEAKYAALERQCRAIEANNLKLMNRIYHVRRITRRAQKERKAIMDQLDIHSDNYRSIDLFFDADVLKDSGFNKAIRPMRMISEKEMTNLTTNMEHNMGSTRSPSKSANTYLNFCQHARKSILQMNPGISQMELAKLLAERWTRLKPNEKEEYHLMYEQSNDKPKLERLEQHIANELKDSSTTEEEHGNGHHHHILSPNLGSFTDGNDLQGNIPLPQIPSPTLVDVDHSFGLSNIPSPSFH